jgi:hypothetical protein
MSTDNDDFDIDIDIDDDELIKMQYKQKGIQHPAQTSPNSRVIYQSPIKYQPENSILCKIDSKMNAFKSQIKYVNSLSSETKKAIQYYTDDGYDKINNYLRHGGEKYIQQVYNSVKLIDQAFKNAPPLTQDVVTFRGIKSSYEIESEFIEKAYTSSTVDLSIALEFNNNSKCCIFKIHVSKGTRVLPLVDCSENASELEVLLPRSSKFKIISTTFDETNNRNVINLKQSV